MSGLKKTGAPALEELRASPAFPADEQMRCGPIAIIECIEEIPCNPCETVCPRKAITVGAPITSLPRIDLEKCTGCAICVAACPGQAIYIKDYFCSEGKSSISFPFEYLPLPQKGDIVKVADRLGNPLCDGLVTRVVENERNDRTVVVTVEFAREHFDQAITIQRL
jgi:Fe-S-cluster-containing hydrogenase component 2